MISFRKPSTPAEWEAYYDLRFRALREPWCQPVGSERLEDDDDAIHLMAVEGEKVIGVGRAHFNSPDEAQIRLMAVDAGHRKRGVGSMLLRRLESIVRERGADHVVMDARDYALEFYLKQGYRVVEESYLLFGSIRHYRMRKEM